VTRFSRTQEKTDRARRLRRDMTNAEWRLWGVLRGGQMGASFRRQHPIGPYFVDFYCAPLKLAIELDGGQHAERQGYDDARTTFLATQGIKVVRYWNNEVMENLDGVCVDLSAAIQGRNLSLPRMALTPSQPPPCRGRSDSASAND
jgi:very-short-patch-repair endonuclease